MLCGDGHLSEPARCTKVPGGGGWRVPAGINPGSTHRSDPATEALATAFSPLPFLVRLQRRALRPHLRSSSGCLESWGLKFRASLTWLPIWPRESENAASQPRAALVSPQGESGFSVPGGALWESCGALAESRWSSALRTPFRSCHAPPTTLLSVPLLKTPTTYIPRACVSAW